MQFPGNLTDALEASVVDGDESVWQLPPLIPGDWETLDTFEAAQILKAFVDEDRNERKRFPRALYYRPLAVRRMELSCFTGVRLLEVSLNIDSCLGIVHMLDVDGEVGALAPDLGELKAIVQSRPLRQGEDAICVFLRSHFSLWRDDFGRRLRIVERREDLPLRPSRASSLTLPADLHPIIPLAASSGRYAGFALLGNVLSRFEIEFDRQRRHAPLVVEDDQVAKLPASAIWVEKLDGDFRVAA